MRRDSEEVNRIRWEALGVMQREVIVSVSCDGAIQTAIDKGEELSAHPSKPTELRARLHVCE